MALGQEDTASGNTLRLKTMGQLLGGLLAALVVIDIEGEIDGARAFAQLVELVRVEMRPQRASNVVKARLSQHGIVEEALDNNDLGAMPDLLPCIQAALGAGHKSMREGSTGAAAVEVDDVFVQAQREDDALIESVRAVHVEQANLPQ